MTVPDGLRAVESLPVRHNDLQILASLYGTTAQGVHRSPRLLLVLSALRVGLPDRLPAALRPYNAALYAMGTGARHSG